MSPEERGKLEKVLDVLVENHDVFLKGFQVGKNEATISAFFAGSALTFFSSIKTDKRMPPTQEDLQELKKIVDSKIKSIPLY